MNERDEVYMRLALAQAKLADQAGEVPVGAVLVYQDQVIARAYNQPIALSDPSAHAEILALRAAGQYLKNYRLLDCTLYVSLQPCMMCMGAIRHARLKRVVYAAPDEKEPVNYALIEEQGPLQAESASLLKQFFRERRAAIGQ